MSIAVQGIAACAAPSRRSSALRGWLAVCAIAWLGGAAPLRAEPAPQPESLRRELDSMLARQDTLERENARLRTQVGALEDRLSGTEAPPAAVSAGYKSDKPPVGLNKGGNGVFIEGQDYSLSFFGYAQAVGSMFDGRIKRSDGHGDFSVRAARLDFLFDYLKDYQLLIEVDAAPGNAVPGQSDFGLIVASLNWKMLGDGLQLEVGKIINPFSTENYRTSRDVDTIERFQALNSMFILPALDAQYGAQLHGTTSGDQKFGYYLGVFNGNGDAFDNLSDNNGRKELTAKFTYGAGQFSAGLGFDYSREREQTLSLTDLGFNGFLSVPIEGKRVGLGADAFWESGPWSLRTEGLAFRFDVDPTPPAGGVFAPIRSDRASLVGGFVQPAVYLWGDHSQGMQLLLRGEVAHLGMTGGSDGNSLYGLTLGANWFLNPNVRLQLNGVLQYFNGSSQLRGFTSRELIPMLLTEIQIKF